MALWTVKYDGWQMECCGMPFSVGDGVAWPLVLLDAKNGLDMESWENWFSEIEGTVEGVPAGYRSA
ncbi:DUF6578 domain-containing protein [Streptomyces sp. 7N604]|uniref:DUF6578 domain-containing protein n=1 Tax=Streptomyces sp. 7N604 TaxID=3457415 RepID=UPI003FD1BE0E